MFAAQFDDTASGESFTLSSPVESFTATSLDEVIPILGKAESASRSGLWVAGYVSYEAAPAFDNALTVRNGTRTPLAWFGTFRERVDTELGTDHREPYSLSRWLPLVDRESYADAFRTIRRHIREGDTYQVNLTFPLRAAFSGDSSALYEELVASQQASYSSHISHPGTEVLSVSPEMFFRVDGRMIRTRPMKGTRPRGRWQAEDDERRADLETSEKDRAENLMIVDLIRNDLGRISEFGSVSVDDLFMIEEYPTVWQMTSQVSARLGESTGLVDVFRALFPCGSVTGAPKARSMEIIADVEPQSRGVYCGAIGFIPPGDGVAGASFNVAIRTAVIDRAEDVVQYGIGGGVTWDSEMDREYEEALTKSDVLAPLPSIDGIVETIRWDGDWLWLEDHIERLLASAEFLGLNVHENDLREFLATLEGELDAPSKVRVFVVGDGECSVEVDPAPSRFSMGPGPEAAPIVVAVDLDAVDPSNPRLFHKTSDRSLYDIRSRRHPEAADVLLTNTQGNVTESTIANVAFRFGDRWVTPPIEDGLLPGVMRARLIADGTLEERHVGVAEAFESDAVALISSVRGWRSAVLQAPS